MIFFRYRAYLEQQVVELKAEKRELQARIDQLTNALVPILRRMDEKGPVKELEPVKRVIHDIKLEGNQAKCTCGWIATGDDPAKLQSEVSKHYGIEVAASRMGRKSWPEARAKLENTPTGENQ